MAQGVDKLVQQPIRFCRSFSCSGSYSKLEDFWLFWQISESIMPKWRTCYFWNPKRPTKHCTSSLLVGEAKGSNLSFIWAEMFWHVPNHQAPGKFTRVASSLISVGFISHHPACMGLTEVSRVLANSHSPGPSSMMASVWLTKPWGRRVKVYGWPYQLKVKCFW